MTTTIGDRIKKRREELGMSQEELALQIGYTSRTTVAKIESGSNELRQSKIKQIADALHTTPSYLMGWVENVDYTVKIDNHSEVNEEIRILIEKYSSADDMTKELVRRILK